MTRPMRLCHVLSHSGGLWRHTVYDSEFGWGLGIKSQMLAGGSKMTNHLGVEINYAPFCRRNGKVLLWLCVQRIKST